MKIRLKNEIVALKDSDLDMQETGPGNYLNAEEWDELISQDNVILIDTRNSYEVAFGTFKNAINPDTQSFSELPEWFKKNVNLNDKNQKIAMFCKIIFLCENKARCD